MSNSMSQVLLSLYIFSIMDAKFVSSMDDIIYLSSMEVKYGRHNALR